MKLNLLFCELLAVAIPSVIFAKPPHEGKSDTLKNAVILVIRHAEKPAQGPELTAAGKARAKAYVDYFKDFTIDGQPLKLDYLIAAADSKASHRSRLTIEPTSKSLGLTIDSRFEESQFQKLADEIRAKPLGKQILICWHHGEIPKLIQALGADPSQVIPKSNWPDSVYDWVIQLRYDADGRLLDAKRIEENF